jgi:hypothetical protein
MSTSRRLSQPSPSASIQCGKSERAYPVRLSPETWSRARSSESDNWPAGGGDDGAGVPGGGVRLGLGVSVGVKVPSVLDADGGAAAVPTGAPVGLLNGEVTDDGCTVLLGLASAVPATALLGVGASIGEGDAT